MHLPADFQRRLMVPSNVTRVMRTVAYISIALAGMAMILLDVFNGWYQTMGWFAVIGGLFAAFGTATGRWIGEYVGLPLLASAMFAFAVLTYRDTWGQAGWVSFPSVMLLTAYGILLTSRWLDVAAVVRAARGHARYYTRRRGRTHGTG